MSIIKVILTVYVEEPESHMLNMDTLTGVILDQLSEYRHFSPVEIPGYYNKSLVNKNDNHKLSDFEAYKTNNDDY